jgi:hypothetical protein
MVLLSLPISWNIIVINKNINNNNPLVIICQNVITESFFESDLDIHMTNVNNSPTSKVWPCEDSSNPKHSRPSELLALLPASLPPPVTEDVDSLLVGVIHRMIV